MGLAARVAELASPQPTQLLPLALLSVRCASLVCPLLRAQVELHLQRVEAAAAHERAVIVHSALASLQHLQEHLASVHQLRQLPSDELRKQRNEMLEDVLLPFNSAKWWRVYGGTVSPRHGGRHELADGPCDSTSSLATGATLQHTAPAAMPAPRAPQAPAGASSSRPGSHVGRRRQWAAKQLPDGFHRCARRAAWHQHRPPEQRASVAVSALADGMKPSATLTARAAVYARAERELAESATGEAGRTPQTARPDVQASSPPGAVPPRAASPGPSLGATEANAWPEVSDASVHGTTTSMLPPIAVPSRRPPVQPPPTPVRVGAT